MGAKLNAFANFALVAVAIAVGGKYLLGSAGEAEPGPPRTPQVAEDWEREFEAGMKFGPDGAPVRIVEFVDFQCPACRNWHLRVDSLRHDFPLAVQVSVHHFPNWLGHPHAMAAAVAAECAYAQGSFDGLYNVLMRDQILFGAQPWRSFASEAGVPDLERFDQCVVRDPAEFPRIDYGLRLAQELALRGTPTVWINGESRRPSLEELKTLAQALQNGPGS